MTILPLDPARDASPEALLSFLRECRSVADRTGRPQLASISLSVAPLDPLAVLESIFDPAALHFYAERPDLETAIAGAETAVSFDCSGPSRFAEAQDWMERVLEDTIAVGAVDAAFGGPHFFCSFAFLDTVEPGEPFPAARIFVPVWQVARAGGRSTAVANLLVAPGCDVGPVAERVWRAHARMRATPGFPAGEAAGTNGARVAPGARGAWQEAGGPASDYRAAVASALGEIAGGAYSKIVLARALDFRAGAPLHPLELLNGLRERFPSCYAFSVANGRGESFIGASPERLVRLSRGVLDTEAMAGSMRRGASAREDAALGASLLESEKDRREHRLVLEAVAGALRERGMEPEHAAEPSLRRLANVQHLHTAVSGAVPAGVRILEVVGALHPTPAVGGLPRGAALARIRALEGFPRGLYAGAIGWVNARGGGEFFVGLRSALVEGRNARLYAGAGVVAGSSPDAEFRETELKFAAMEKALAGG